MLHPVSVVPRGQIGPQSSVTRVLSEQACMFSPHADKPIKKYRNGILCNRGHSRRDTSASECQNWNTHTHTQTDNHSAKKTDRTKTIADSNLIIKQNAICEIHNLFSGIPNFIFLSATIDKVPATTSVHFCAHNNSWVDFIVPHYTTVGGYWFSIIHGVS